MTSTTVFKYLLVTVVLLAGSPALSTAQEIQTISHGEQVDITASLSPGKLTLIDFYADWCGPCRALAPRLERMASAKSDSLAIKKVDIVNWDSAVAAQYRIQSIPHLKLFDENGQLLVEGDSGRVMRVLESRLAGGDRGAVNGRSFVPIFLVGGLAALAVFLVLRGKTTPDVPGSAPIPVSRPGESQASGWFVMMQDSLEGPFAEEDLEEMVRRRRISGTAKARRKGQSSWKTVAEVIEHLI